MLPWLPRDSNKRPRTRICQCFVDQFTRIDWRRTTCYFSIYHPQSNGLVERQIKNDIVKVLDEKTTDWPYIIEGILFAHRVSRHSSIQYSPFYLLYNREPILPIDVKFNLADRKNDDTEPSDRETFEAVLASATTIRGETHEFASNTIKKAQEKRK